jgi:hypothetical protein
MKTPTWGTVIGIMMIIFGGCGALNDIRSISMPEELAKQKELVKKKLDEKHAKRDSLNITETDSLVTTAEEEKKEVSIFGHNHKVEEMLDLSEFTKTWIVRFGYIGAFVSLLYALAGVFLLKPKAFSIKLVYAALIISILCSGAQAAVLTSSSAGGFIAITTGLSQFVGIIIDIILLSVVFASDKEAYAVENLSR